MNMFGRKDKDGITRAQVLHFIYRYALACNYDLDSFVIEDTLGVYTIRVSITVEKPKQK